MAEIATEIRKLRLLRMKRSLKCLHRMPCSALNASCKIRLELCAAVHCACWHITKRPILALSSLSRQPGNTLADVETCGPWTHSPQHSPGGS